MGDGFCRLAKSQVLQLLASCEKGGGNIEFDSCTISFLRFERRGKTDLQCRINLRSAPPPIVEADLIP